MNQPRYSDGPGGVAGGGGNSWHNNANGGRRSVQSTGRSNYGGSSRGRNRGGAASAADGEQRKKGPLGTWIQNRRQRRLRRQRSSAGGAVGTEANALKNMAKNAKHFDYPEEGFETPIEHSLLYAMIEHPARYPEGVVKAEIEEEEFEVYLYVNDEKRRKPSDGDGEGAGGGGDNDDRGEDEGSDQAGSERRPSANTSHADGDERRVSYAQLSAIAALSAEKNSSTAFWDQTTAATNQPPVDWSESPSSRAPDPPKEPPLTVGQSLVRRLLRVVTRYSDAHGLDRQHEIREFLSPVERRCQVRNEQAALKQLLPAYAGYTLSLVTGNPLPLLIGAAALTGPDLMEDENCNVSEFRAVGGRAGDM
ncbi:hypothetical protein ACHAWF_009015, partial [Thalassiosira exigua]